MNKKTYLFVTNLQAGTTLGSASLVVTKDAAGNIISWNWGNGMAVFGSGLNNIYTIIHELGHSLNLTHTQENPAVSNTPAFYQGFTDNVMDYNWTILRPVDPTNLKKGFFGDDKNPPPYKDKMWYFFKWQWDLIRQDGSLTD